MLSKKLGKDKLRIIWGIFLIAILFSVILSINFRRNLADVGEDLTVSDENYTAKLIGSNPQYVEVKTKYNEKGVLFLKEDNTKVDASKIGAKVETSSSDVNVNKLGDYTVTYVVTFENGKIVTLNRNIIVKDTIAPVISLLGLNPYEIQIDQEFLEQGYNVVDNYDEIVDVVIDKSKIDFKTVGEYLLFYTATDKSGNKTVISRKVIVSAKKIPEVKEKYTVELNGLAMQYVEVGTKYNESGVIFYNSTKQIVDVSNIGALVKIDSKSVNTDKIGNYVVEYTIIFSDGTVKNLKRSVTVKDSKPPIITLLGKNPYELYVNEIFVEQGYNVADNYNENIKVTIDKKNINFNVPGKYKEVYTATDKSGNECSIYRVIIILKNTYDSDSDSDSDSDPKPLPPGGDETPVLPPPVKPEPEPLPPGGDETPVLPPPVKPDPDPLPPGGDETPVLPPPVKPDPDPIPPGGDETPVLPPPVKPDPLPPEGDETPVLPPPVKPDPLPPEGDETPVLPPPVKP